MSQWIFKCNPDRYRIDARLADPNPQITWTVTRYADQIQRGDTVYLWQTGKQRSIRAVLKLDSNPEERAELESEQQYWKERDTQVKTRVLATITHRDVNLSADDLRAIAGLENLSMFHGFQQQTNFPVTPAEGTIIDDLIRRRAAPIGNTPQ